MGVVFVLLFLVAFGLDAKDFPAAGVASAEEVLAFVEANHFRIGVSAFINVLSWMAFVWFLGSARAALARAEEGGRLSSISFAAGILIAGLSLAGTALSSEVIFADWAAHDEATIVSQWAIYDAGGGFFGMTPLIRAVFVGAASLVALRYGALPRWLGWVGLVTVFANGLGGLDYFLTEDRSLTGHPLVDLLAFLGWVSLTSGYLTIRREGP